MTEYHAKTKTKIYQTKEYKGKISQLHQVCQLYKRWIQVITK
jgi:hypothetical protein